MYELMVIGRAEDADSLFTKIEKMVKDVSASNVTSQKMGKKLLAYPIKKQAEAEYFIFNFEAPGEAVGQISEGLRLEQEAVLRYMIITTKSAKAKKASKVIQESQEPEEIKVSEEAAAGIAKETKKSDTKKTAKTTKEKKGKS